MRISSVTLMLLMFMTFPVLAEEVEVMPPPPSAPEKIPFWKQRHRLLEEMQQFLNELQEDCDMRGKACTTKAQLEELRRLRDEMEATQERERMIYGPIKQRSGGRI